MITQVIESEFQMSYIYDKKNCVAKEMPCAILHNTFFFAQNFI